MSARKLLSFAVMFLLVATVSFGQKRTEKGSVVISAEGVFVAQCEGFQVLTDYVGLFSWADLFDKNGQWVKENSRFRLIGDSIYYNSKDATKSLPAGPGEAENDHFVAATGVWRFSGIVFKIKLPGHGLIFVETGETVYQCDPYTWTNCVPVKNTGHNLWVDGDVAALCDHLK
jgi:hypothetical protein